MSSNLLLSLFIHYFPSTRFSIQKNILFLEQTGFNVIFVYQTLIQTFQTDWVDSPTPYNLFIQNSYYIYYIVLCHPYFNIVLSQLSILTIIYFIIGVKSFSPTFLGAMSANWRPLSHQSILCNLHFSPFLTKWVLLAMCLVCLVSLLLLVIHIADLPSKSIRGASSGDISVSLFNYSWINILKCAKAIPTVHDELYSLSTVDWATSPEKCVSWSTGPPW